MKVQVGGTYRNRLGVLMIIDHFDIRPGGYETLGDTYVAHTEDPLFGTASYLVTSTSLKEKGYELVEESGE